jgi:DNA polymerase III subunit gamma/tau
VTDALAAGDAAATLGAVETLSRSGRDPGQFARDLVAHLRQLLVARATGAVPESFTVTVAQPDRLAAQAAAVDDAKLMGAIDALSVAIANMREGDDPRLSLEVALLKVARPSLDASREALLRRIESLESRLKGEPSKGRPSAPPEGASAPPVPAGEAEDMPATSEAEDVPVDAALDLERVASLWPAVVDHVRSSGSAMLSTLFDGARPLAIDAERGTIRIGFPPSAKFNKRKAEVPANVERVADAVAAIAGERLRPVYELMEGEVPPAATEGAAASEMSEEEFIDLVRTNFDASEVIPEETRGEETG